MIRLSDGELEVGGTFGEVLTETTYLINKLCNMYDRREVMSSIMSAQYLVPENEDAIMDIPSAIKEFKGDVKAALDKIELMNKAEGKTFKEKNISMHKRNEQKRAEIEHELNKWLKDFKEKFGGDVEIDIEKLFNDEEDDDE